MFELGDRLVGIYKVQDCTNSITIKNFRNPESDLVFTQPSTSRATQNHNVSFTINPTISSQTTKLSKLPTQIHVDENLKSPNAELTLGPFLSPNRFGSHKSPTRSPITSNPLSVVRKPGLQLHDSSKATSGRNTTFSPNIDLQSTARSFIASPSPNKTMRTSTSKSKICLNKTDGVFKKPLTPPPRPLNI